MTYGQIITLLFILLILYYAGLVTMDIIAAKRMKASEEAEIDISGLAGGFEAVEIKRDNSRPAKIPHNMGAVRYKEPVMTNGYPVDTLIAKTKNAVESGRYDDLDNLVYKCEAA